MEITERNDPAVILEVETLCRELHHHHGLIAPSMAGLPLRSADDCWERKRRDYEQWLREEDGSFVLLATEREAIIGFALIRIVGGYQGWASENQVAMLEALTVLDGHRGRGVGGSLMNEIFKHLGIRGVTQMRVQLIDANVKAKIFYEKHGFTTVINEMFVNLEGMPTPPAAAIDQNWFAQYELQVSSWIYADTQSILSRMAMLVAADSIFLALALQDARTAATRSLVYAGAVLLVLAIFGLLWGSKHVWGIPVAYAQEGRRPLTLEALAAQTSARADWVSKRKASWLHLGALLTAIGILLTGVGFLVNL